MTGRPKVQAVIIGAGALGLGFLAERLAPDYDLCLAEYAYDVLNPGAPTGANSVTISTGANQPYLLLALPFVGHHAVGRGVGNGVHMGIG